MYLAHSTRTSSCSFIDSHTSVMLAIFFARMSPLIPEMGEVICGRQGNAEHGRFSLHFLSHTLGGLPMCVCGGAARLCVLPGQWEALSKMTGRIPKQEAPCLEHRLLTGLPCPISSSS